MCPSWAILLTELRLIIVFDSYFCNFNPFVMTSIVVLNCWPALSFSFGIVLLVVASHVCHDFVLGFVLYLHFISNPLSLVHFVFLVPEAIVVMDVGMWLAMILDFAAGARV